VTSLMHEMGARALRLGIPLGAQLDLTYRCNERCVHCYLDHDDHGEMTLAEIKDLLGQLADAGVFFLTLSGGEIFLRPDLFDIVEHARKLLFAVKIKTNGILIREPQARRLADLGVEAVQISIYSHRPEVHDGITLVPGSLERSIRGARLLKAAGVKVTFANVLMRQNVDDYLHVKALAREVGAGFNLDPTITPMMDGDRSILSLNIDRAALRRVVRDTEVVDDVSEFCAPPSGPLDLEDAYARLPCSAGHTSCYVSPYGDVYPCVQFPLPCGNVRREKFIDIWRNSRQFKEVRSITLGDLEGCSSCGNQKTCTRCPGLAYMEGNMRGPSTQDCEKSLARTGLESANLRAKRASPSPPSSPAGFVPLVQVRLRSGSGLETRAGRAIPLPVLQEATAACGSCSTTAAGR
jgi:radical SAM protein with 4Fe4S-binding SPASM domain